MRHTPRHDRDTETDRRERLDDYTRERRGERDASGSWRREYRHAHTPLPDGGAERAGWILPNPGARVRDRDADEGDGDELLVVATHPTTPAEEYRLEALDGTTVAEVNPEYDERAPVVEAVYLDGAREHLEDADDALGAILQAVDAGAITAYSFPADRLAAADEGGGTA